MSFQDSQFPAKASQEDMIKKLVMFAGYKDLLSIMTWYPPVTTGTSV
jgi:hypothetical protein